MVIFRRHKIARFEVNGNPRRDGNCGLGNLTWSADCKRRCAGYRVAAADGCHSHTTDGVVRIAPHFRSAEFPTLWNCIGRLLVSIVEDQAKLYAVEDDDGPVLHKEDHVADEEGVVLDHSRETNDDERNVVAE